MNKPLKLPGPDHPIAVVPTAARVVIRAGGRVVADTRHALTLREAAYPPVHYIPRADVDMTQLTRTAHASYCPYKGDASYYSLPGAANAGWSYEDPHPAMAAIRNHIAFYPDKVDSIEMREQ